MKTILSGMQPSGQLHIGNYLGALKNWVELQNSDNYKCIFMIADLHAMTTVFDPHALPSYVRSLAIDYLASGLDPKKSIIFIQSHIPEHTYLSWIFSSLVPIAELKRMHQFKEKTAAEQEDAINAGLFTYPILMAADILIYRGDTVPVGEDQKQHVEITRMIAKKFNTAFGETFPEPDVLLTPTPRVMSLSDPSSKMSKSKGEKHYIALSDDPETIRKKIMGAVTDTAPGALMSPGIENLFGLLHVFTEDKNSYHTLLEEYKKGTLKYRELKETLAEELIKTLAPMQERRRELEAHPDAIGEILIEGTQKAREIARQTFEEVRKKTGLL